MTNSNAAAAASKPIGTYSPTRIIPLGKMNLVFVSGLTSGGQAPYDIACQAEIVFAQMKDLLAEAGGKLEHLVKITTYLVDMRDYDVYNKVRNGVFAQMSKPPASATVGTTQLVRPELRIEIEAVAIIPSS